MKRCDMTFGARADVSQCQGQVQFWDDGPWDHYIGRDEHVNQVYLAGWLYRHLDGSHWERRGWMKDLKDPRRGRCPLLPSFLRKPWSWSAACSRSNGTGIMFRTSEHKISPVKNVSIFSYQAPQSWVFPLFVVSFVFYVLIAKNLLYFMYFLLIYQSWE